MCKMPEAVRESMERAREFRRLCKFGGTGLMGKYHERLVLAGIRRETLGTLEALRALRRQEEAGLSIGRVAGTVKP